MLFELGLVPLRPATIETAFVTADVADETVAPFVDDDMCDPAKSLIDEVELPGFCWQGVEGLLLPSGALAMLAIAIRSCVRRLTTFWQAS